MTDVRRGQFTYVYLCRGTISFLYRKFTDPAKEAHWKQEKEAKPASFVHQGVTCMAISEENNLIINLHVMWLYS